MKVAFNARLLRDHGTRGWNRYTINLLRELPALGVEVFLYTDAPIHDEHLARLPGGSYRVRTSPPVRYFWWEQRWLRRQCDRDRIDIFHCPLNFGVSFFSPCPRVLTLHDAIDQVYPTGGARLGRWRPAALKSAFHHWVARRRSEHVITVSEHSRGDLIRALRIPPTRISVIPEAADPLFQAPAPVVRIKAAQRGHGLSRPYVFYVGGFERRKNIPFLIRAFAEAGLKDVDLALAGGGPERAEMAQCADSLGVGERVRFLGRVPDADLPALYGGAVCFVYPSEYEGFGLQLCEAMAAGCPVLSSEATSLPEVLGDGGETFPLDTCHRLSGLLRRVAEDRPFRDDLIRRGTSRSQEFSWRSTAEQTVALYADLMASQSRRGTLTPAGQL